MSATGEVTPRGRRVAYARGCSPHRDKDWRETARAEAGGDDFSEEVILTERMISCLLEKGKPLRITISEKNILTGC